ncbi:MAG: CDP-diacylglycerol--glycerol-3-phosphate 3-phosphatidyltransferase [Treponema sp.]|nr:CDP-diacylglycerol--glycerol-3-phosphate 3-phosphatidyltransferase [Treponema sp.]
MNFANILTLFRIILAPAFLIIYLLPKSGAFWAIPVLWVIFIISEITDFFDGLAARKLNLTSDFGKLFDPFADTLVQITCFLCFIIDGIWGEGIFPVILFLLVIYREFAILFLRNLMLKEGVTLGARMCGKVKTVFYIIAAGTALLAASLERLIFIPAAANTQIMNAREILLPYFKTGSLVIFILSVCLAVISFIDYLAIYLKTKNTRAALAASKQEKL